MRTYGRITNAEGNLQWVEVTTDANGRNDNVWLTTLAQNLKLGVADLEKIQLQKIDLK